jgi:hypothetical protein
VQHAALHHFDVVILGDWVQTKEDGFSMMRWVVYLFFVFVFLEECGHDMVNFG